MFSKTLSLTLAAVMFLTVGCGLKLGEKNKTENIAEIKSASCLRQSVDQLKTFIKGEATDDQVAESIQCLQNVLIAFKDNIRGANQDAYTPKEVGNFLSQQFLKDGTEFNDELLAQIAKLKVLLVGGTEELITKEEVIAISSIVARLKPGLVKLNPHMKVIVSKWTPENKSQDEQKFKNAKKAFDGFLISVANLLASTDRGYRLEDLIDLAVEVAKFAKVEDSTVKKIADAENLLVDFKIALIGGNAALRGKEWISFGRTLGEVYFQSLRFKYFYDNLKEDQIPEKWKVYENVVIDGSNLIQDLLTAKNDNEITNAEILHILDSAKPLVSNFNVSPELIKQVTKIKDVFFGSGQTKSDTMWTKADFAALSAKAPVIFKNIGIILQNFKHVKVDKEGFRKNQIKYEDFNKAEAAIVQAVGEISIEIVSNYDLNDLKLLIVNLSETLLKDTLKLPDNFNDLMELLKSAKLTLTGQTGSEISKANLQLLLNVGIRAYGHYVEFVNFINVFKLEEKEFIYSFDKLASKAEQTLALELKLKSSHMISTAEISQLVLQAQKMEFIKTKIKESTLETTLNALWSNILNTPESRLAETAQAGLNAVVLKQLAQELHLWINNQKAITDLFDKKAEQNKEELLTGLNAKQGLNELKRALTAPGFMNFNDKGYLKINTNTNNRYRAKDLSNSNLGILLGRIIIRSYAKEIERVNQLTGASLEEVQTAFGQLKFLLHDLKLVDPENKTFIESRFREANLFLAPSNGDGYASFTEIHHLILHILSGVERADSLKKIILDKCLKTENKEDVNKSIIDQTCLMDLYFNEQASFDDVPAFLGMRKEVAQNGSVNTEFCAKDENKESEDCKTLELNQAYFIGLLKAAGHVENDDRPNTVILGDANLFPHVVQYVEMVYSTHDANRDGFLQKSEALNAYPVFAETMKLLKAQLKDLDGNDFVGVFVWLLKKGTILPINNMKKFARDHVCNMDPNPPAPCAQDWTVNSSRVEIGKIFNLIAAFTKPASVNPNVAEPKP
ncbi:hypothetical protein K2P97_06775 [bacterium]|nr:hypothetical protein [bacterium]